MLFTRRLCVFDGVRRWPCLDRCFDRGWNPGRHGPRHPMRPFFLHLPRFAGIFWLLRGAKRRLLFILCLCVATHLVLRLYRDARLPASRGARSVFAFWEVGPANKSCAQLVISVLPSFSLSLTSVVHSCSACASVLLLYSVALCRRPSRQLLARRPNLKCATLRRRSCLFSDASPR